MEIPILFLHDSSREQCALRQLRILQELLRELVHDAHTLGLKVVLDVLLGPVRKRWGRGLGSEGFDPPVSSSMAMKNRPFIGFYR